MRWGIFVGVSGCCAWLFASACSGGSVAYDECSPGERLLCEVDGCQGSKTCNAESKQYGPCLCESHIDGDSGGAPASGGSGGLGGHTGVGGRSGGAPGTGGDPPGVAGAAGVGGLVIGGTGGLVTTGATGGLTTGGVGGTGNVTVTGGTGIVGEACAGLDFSTGGTAGTCVVASYAAEPVPVDLFVMLDRSVSMIEHTVEVGGEQVTRWEAINRGMQAFVNDPAAVGARMGLGVFSYSGTDNDAIECNSANYAEPKVEIGPMAQTGPQVVTYIQDLESNYQLGGFTPTSAALEGAILHAKQWATANPARKTHVVLVSDGMPTQCTLDVAAIAAIAGAGANTDPPITTWVIGVQGAWNVQQIAQAGGTQVIVVGETGDAAVQFTEALRRIVSEPHCEYRFRDPENSGAAIDFDAVSMVRSAVSGAQEEFPRVADFSACATSPYGGWTYDDPAAAADGDPGTEPSKLLVCPCTCARLGASRPSLRLGCAPALATP